MMIALRLADFVPADPTLVVELSEGSGLLEDLQLRKLQRTWAGLTQVIFKYTLNSKYS